MTMSPKVIKGHRGVTEVSLEGTKSSGNAIGRVGQVSIEYIHYEYLYILDLEYVLSTNCVQIDCVQIVLYKLN